MMKKVIFTIGVLVSCSAYSQVGINTETPKATLDVTGKPSDLTKADGIIAPRLTGSELKTKDALYTTDQKASLVYVTHPLAASDTTSKTINVTSIGYFYFDGNVWQKLNTGITGGVVIEPWYDVLTNQPADSNTQNIYQMGSVSVGKNKVTDGVKLDVNGAVRGGNTNIETVGQNSIAVGDALTASGQNSAAFGWHNQATGQNAMAWGGQPGHGTTQEERYSVASGVASTAWGYGTRATSWGTTSWGQGNQATNPQATAFGASNIASGFWSTAFGQRNVASNNNATAFGADNIASEANSLAFGQRNEASATSATVWGIDNKATGVRATAFGQANEASGVSATAYGRGNIVASSYATALGSYSVIATGNPTGWTQTDALFQIGNGVNATSRSNALTVLKNGNIGVGEIAPSVKLDINNGTTNGAIKIVDGTQGDGKVLTSDANGVGTWRSTKVYAVKGDSGGYDIPFDEFSEFKYTGASITLPPGKWLVTITQFTYISGSNSASVGVLAPSDAWMLVRATFSDQTNLTTVGQNGSPSADITQPSTMAFTVKGPHREDSKTGVIYINNTSGGNKTYKYIVGQTQVSGTTSSLFLNNFAGNWAENSITAIAIN